MFALESFLPGVPRLRGLDQGRLPGEASGCASQPFFSHSVSIFISFIFRSLLRILVYKRGLFFLVQNCFINEETKS